MKDGMNLVLFRGSEISTTDSASSNDAWLFYKGNKTHQVTEIRVNSVSAGRKCRVMFGATYLGSGLTF